MVSLDWIQTLALAAGAVCLGYGLCRATPLFRRYNLPPPVVGGLAIACALSLLRTWAIGPIGFDNALQRPLMNAFFTSIGFRVSFNLLRRGGAPMLWLLLLSAVGAALQNLVGMAIALLMRQPILFGVICGSLTLAGGPATAVAFAPQFEKAGIPNAEVVAIVAAIFGIVVAGILSSPLSTVLIGRLNLRRIRVDRNRPEPIVFVNEEPPLGEIERSEGTRSAAVYSMLKGIALVLIAMWIGSSVGNQLTAHGMTLPSYIGGMIVAAMICNLDDLTHWIGLSHRSLDVIGRVTLALFLAMALMTLELWKLADIALPMTVILVAQVVLMIAYSVWPVFATMGRDYDAAVTAGGFFGFMIGITANAMACMDSVVKRYGPAPVAYLAVPMVGGFFIDFVNALLIQGSINLFR